jgi:hypothetical protein
MSRMVHPQPRRNRGQQVASTTENFRLAIADGALPPASATRRISGRPKRQVGQAPGAIGLVESSQHLFECGPEMPLLCTSGRVTKECLHRR